MNIFVITNIYDDPLPILPCRPSPFLRIFKTMMKRSEGFFSGFEDERLFYQSWEPVQSKGVVILTHGHGEHSDCYSRLIEGLAPLSLTIHAWDLRGHGRSEGQRGYAKDFENYVFDLEAFFSYLIQERSIEKKNIFLIAHSMGGLIQTQALLRNPQWPVTAQSLSSPLFGIALEVSLLKDFAALALAQVLPQVTLGNQILDDQVTRDPEVINEFAKDVLRHDRMSPAVYLGSLIAMQSLKKKVHKIKCPTLIQIPDQDSVVSSETARLLFQKWGSAKKSLKEYADFRHELFNDLGREKVFQDLVKFFQEYIKEG